ncbi:TRAP transporter substrate-binding protein [Alkalihalobacillus oceani]|uniref:TRAP transporter substrate-binding protein n=1 Tax=Halalkalibacter oceani TaxID=1653776 RepID=A0A9X2DSN6_9BACI|nr:TRAP transporter substrate-binding protein [Halalkalibacter oceani]MCM3716304.1 TRAP transporter substrate-binding protein [Halalkalibacter oceani]
MKKSWLSLLLLGCLIGLLAACGGGETTTNNDDSDTASQEGNGGDQEPIVLRLGHWLTEEAPQGKQYTNFANLVNEKTNGAVQVEVFPNSQLGNARDLLEGVISGTVDMTKADDAALASYVPEYGIYSLPFIFEDYEHLGNVLDSEITEEIDQKLLEETGLVSLGWSFGGFRYFITTEEVTGPDFNGLKIRAPESTVYIETIKLLNGNATPMPWGEVYTGLETGIISGLESAPSDLHLQKFYEETKYLLATNHIQASATTVINQDKWNSIPEEYQTIIKEAMREAIEIERTETEQANIDGVEAMVEEGLILNEVEDRQAFIDKVQPIWDSISNEIEGAQDIIEQIQAMK